MKYQKCNQCNGVGTILNHMHSPLPGQRSAGQGVSVCPSCNGSGNNGALDLSSQKYSGKSPGEIQGEKIGEGCVTVLFSIGPYLIVFYALFNLITHGINILSNTYAFNTPEWLPITAVLSIFSAVLFYKKYIGRMALLSIVILVGINHLFDENVNKQTTPQEKSVASNTLTKKQRAINAIKEARKGAGTTATSTRSYNFNPTKEETIKTQCKSCVRWLKIDIVKDPKTKAGIQKNCNTIISECRKYQLVW